MKPLSRGDSKAGPTFRAVLAATVIYVGVVLIFTAVGAFASRAAAQIGTARPVETIPDHVAELAGFGVVLGAGSALVYGRKGLPLVVLAPALTVLLDLDHLPVFLGYPQTIRPAHSLLFIAAVLAITAITIKRLDIDLVVLSATLGHMGIDTGIFAPFSPVSFDYIRLDPYRVPLLIGAVAAAVLAGVVLRREKPKGGAEGTESDA